MKVLNAYSGIGGNRKNWNGRKHDITAVEINEEIANEYGRLYPEDEVIIGDAHAYIKAHYHELDFIWASPPCQKHSQMHLLSAKSDKKQNKNREPEYPDMKLYQEIIFLRNFFDGDWVVENVRPYYEPLIEPQKCGRHRIWSNFTVPDIEVPRGFDLTGASTRAKIEELEEWLGIELSKNIYVKDSHDPGQVLRNAVHPKIGEAIFKNRNTKQQSLASVKRTKPTENSNTTS